MAAQTLFGQPSSPATLTSDTSDYTMGMQFTLSSSAPLTGIWFFSATGAGALPAACCIYQMTGAGTGSQVSGTVNTSPTWSGAAGSGWVKVTYPGTTTLASGTTYKVCVFYGGGSNFYSHTANYWTSGAGGSGLTSGIITAPNNAGGDGGQDTFTNPAALLVYPASSFNAANYWVDVEVTPSSGTNAPAGVATGLAVAPGAKASIAVTAGVATGHATAPGATGSANTAASAGVATAQAVAPGAKASIAVTAGVATGHATAPPATGSTNTAASAGVATAAGGAASARVAIAAQPPAAIAWASNALDDQAGGPVLDQSGAAIDDQDATTVALGVLAGIPVVLGVAPPAVVNTTGGPTSTQAPAGVATSAATALAARISLAALPGVATARAVAPAVPLEAVPARSVASVSDPRDGTAAVTALVTSAAGVS